MTEEEYRQEWYAAVAQKIRSVLKRRKMTGRDLARLTGFRTSAISKVLSGKTNIELKTIAKLEFALQESIIEINWGTPTEQPNATNS